MPHSTRPSVTLTQHGDTNNKNTAAATVRTSMEKFPDMNTGNLDGTSQYFASPISTINGNGSINGNNNGNGNGIHGAAPSADRWQSSRRESRLRGASWLDHPTNGSPRHHGHTKQKSLGDALRTIRTRKGSVSANVHELSDALKAPVSPKLIVS